MDLGILHKYNITIHHTDNITHTNIGTSNSSLSVQRRMSMPSYEVENYRFPVTLKCSIKQ